MAKEGKIKVLIADDSPLVREILKDMVSGESDLEVVGEANNGRDAVRLAEALSPDIITMDVMMPVMNGLEAVEEIMAYHPTPILVFSSAVNNKEMDVAFQSIARGALDVMEKPKGAGGAHYDEIRDDLLNKLRILSRIHVIPHLRGKRKKQERERNLLDNGGSTSSGEKPVRPARVGAADAMVEVFRQPRPPAPEAAERIEEVIDRDVVKLNSGTPPRKLVAVGASTGGPKALVQIFRRIPADFPLPIVTVQHIAHSFAPGLVAWLDRESPMKVVLAQDKDKPAPGIMYVSPTNVHLVIDRGILRLTDSPPVNSCRPSVDVLFHSVADFMGEQTVGVLLTGMGRDGATGLKAIKDKNGWTMIQDQKTCVIFGMPRAAMELGAHEEEVSLNDIPDAMARAIFSRPRRG